MVQLSPFERPQQTRIWKRPSCEDTDGLRLESTKSIPAQERGKESPRSLQGVSLPEGLGTVSFSAVVTFPSQLLLQGLQALLSKQAWDGRGGASHVGCLSPA